MKLQGFLKWVAPHFLALVVFLVILFLYFSPTLSGKKLVQSDIIQSTGALKESIEYQKKGEEVLWSNSGFGGMPVWRGYGSNVIHYVHDFISTILPVPVLLCFLGFAGFYILLKTLRLNNWLSFAGAAAYAFSTFTIISIEVGHINKVFDMVFMAPVIAGFILIYRGRYLPGTAILTLFLSLQIFYSHVQITYYLVIICFIYVITEFIISIREKTVPAFIKSSIFILIACILAVAPNIAKLWTMSEYVKSTTRGGTELVQAGKKEEAGGLSKEYALSWSNSIPETMTLFIPYFYGGSSHENLGTSSNAYQALAKNGYRSEAKEFSRNVPLYWGDQPFTAGPVYIGAIICFLFVLGLFIVKSHLKWWILVTTILAIMLSWGRNLEWFTDIFFYYVPMYNKFRAVTMILSIVQVMLPLLGFLALRDIQLERVSRQEVLNGLKWSTIIMGGIALLFVLMGGAFFDFTSVNDAKLQLPDWLMNAIVEDRKDRFRLDAFRSLFFVLATAGLTWMWVQDKVRPLAFYLLLSGLIIIDLFMVDKRYLNSDDFKYKTNFEKEIFQTTEADDRILADKDPYFRVFNVTTDPTGDGITSYYHKSLGGYSAIKLRRYQDIIDSALMKNNRAVINMLNTKYFIGRNQQTGEAVAQLNPEAMGNVWFVDGYKLVKNANEELKSLENFNPAQTAIIDERFKDQVQGKTFSKDPEGSIRLTSYHPDKLVYKSKSSKEQLAVFSEIYYQPGWNAYIDGKLVPHFRTDYILRGMVVPAGEHTIEFRFEPKSYFVGKKISLAGSVGLVAFLLVVVGLEVLKKVRNQPSESR